MTREEKINKFVETFANYVETHKRYDELTKREVVIEAIRLLFNDIGAAHDFFNAFGFYGFDIDLYEVNFDTLKKCIESSKKE